MAAAWTGQWTWHPHGIADPGFCSGFTICRSLLCGSPTATIVRRRVLRALYSGLVALDGDLPPWWGRLGEAPPGHQPPLTTAPAQAHNRGGLYAVKVRRG